MVEALRMIVTTYGRDNDGEERRGLFCRLRVDF